jgi:hypothetical protein
MPHFCTSCGSPLEEGDRFCMTCGEPADGIARPSIPPPEPSPPDPPDPVEFLMSAFTPRAEASAPIRRPVTAKRVILAVLGVLALIGILALVEGLYMGFRTRRTHEMDAVGKTVNAETPGGSIPVTENLPRTTSPPGPAVYPGATDTGSGGEFTVAGRGTILRSEYQTADSLDAVVAFYKEQMGPKAHMMHSDTEAIFHLGDQATLTTVSVSRTAEEEHTRIVISRITK